MRYLYLLACLSVFTSPILAAEPGPNIILIYADDLGYGDLGCYGNTKIKTPHLDRLATEGMRFTSFYSTASVCTPSRAALLTGRYQIRSGLVRVLFPRSQDGIDKEEITLAEALKERGYRTACIGKWHLGHLPPYLPTKHGFDQYFGIPYSNDMQPTPLMRDEKTIEEPAVQTTLTNRYTNEAIKFLDENRERPFFLYLPQTMPHVPLAVSEKFKGRSAGGLYGDVIEELDDSVGRILEALKKHNLDEKTLIVFSSDNGPWLIKKEHGGTAGPLRNGKGTLFEGGIRVPTLARWPGRIKAGSVANAPAIMTDWFPTIVKLAGGTVPMDRAIDGKDLAPVLFGKGERADQEFYFYQGNQLHAHRSGPWKVIQVGAGKPGVKPPRPMLFNLEDDLGETTDLAEQKPEILQRLIKQMEAFQQGLGKVTPPKM